MNYSPHAFAALLEEIEGAGGASLPEICSPEKSEFVEDFYTPLAAPDGTPILTHTQGCLNATQFLMPAEEGSLAKVCAVCDAVGAWPKFIKRLKEVDPDMEYWDRLKADDEEESNEPAE